jgi:hypothetical protein
VTAGSAAPRVGRRVPPRGGAVGRFRRYPVLARLTSAVPLDDDGGLLWPPWITGTGE